MSSNNEVAARQIVLGGLRLANVIKVIFGSSSSYSTTEAATYEAAETTESVYISGNQENTFL